jgi:hypothetical protein
MGLGDESGYLLDASSLNRLATVVERVETDPRFTQGIETAPGVIQAKVRELAQVAYCQVSAKAPSGKEITVMPVAGVGTWPYGFQPTPPDPPDDGDPYLYYVWDQVNQIGEQVYLDEVTSTTITLTLANNYPNGFTLQGCLTQVGASFLTPGVLYVRNGGQDTYDPIATIYLNAANALGVQAPGQTPFALPPGIFWSCQCSGVPAGGYSTAEYTVEFGAAGSGNANVFYIASPGGFGGESPLLQFDALAATPGPSQICLQPGVITDGPQLFSGDKGFAGNVLVGQNLHVGAGAGGVGYIFQNLGNGTGAYAQYGSTPGIDLLPSLLEGGGLVISCNETVAATNPNAGVLLLTPGIANIGTPGLTLVTGFYDPTDPSATQFGIVYTQPAYQIVNTAGQVLVGGWGFDSIGNYYAGGLWISQGGTPGQNGGEPTPPGGSSPPSPSPPPIGTGSGGGGGGGGAAGGKGGGALGGLGGLGSQFGGSPIAAGGPVATVGTSSQGTVILSSDTQIAVGDLTPGSITTTNGISALLLTSSAAFTPASSGIVTVVAWGAGGAGAAGVLTGGGAGRGGDIVVGQIAVTASTNYAAQLTAIATSIAGDSGAVTAAAGSSATGQLGATTALATSGGGRIFAGQPGGNGDTGSGTVPSPGAAGQSPGGGGGGGSIGQPGGAGGAAQMLLLWSSGSGGFTAGGDLSGSSSSQTVIGIQGKAVSGTAPTSNQVLLYSLGQWAPATASVASAFGNTITVSGAFPSLSLAVTNPGGVIGGSMGGSPNSDGSVLLQSATGTLAQAGAGMITFDVAGTTNLLSPVTLYIGDPNNVYDQPGTLALWDSVNQNWNPLVIYEGNFSLPPGVGFSLQGSFSQSGPSISTASGDLFGTIEGGSNTHSGSVSSVAAATSPTGYVSVWAVGGTIKITSYTSGGVTLQVAFTDMAGSNQTLSLIAMGQSTATLSASGIYVFPQVTIAVASNTTITISTVHTGSNSYDVYGTITELS